MRSKPEPGRLTPSKRTAGAGLAVLLCTACAQAPLATMAGPPPTSYTAETTHAKLAPGYPGIRIASRAVPDGVTAVRDITYVRYGTRSLQLDLYLPSAPGGKPAPGIVFVHGGGWRVGVRENFAPMAIRMAQHGYAAATISYRLAGEAPFPAAVLDARAAVRWMRTHGARHGIDPRRIALAGGSAGGQIATLAGMASRIPGFDPADRSSGISGDVQAVVDIDGLSDFEAEVWRLRAGPAPGQPAAWSAWFGGWFQGANDALPALWRAASPVTHAGPGSPPFLFIGSSIPRYGAGHEQLIGKLHAAGIAADARILPGTPHSFWLFDPWLAPTVDATVSFLRRHL